MYVVCFLDFWNLCTTLISYSCYIFQCTMFTRCVCVDSKQRHSRRFLSISLAVPSSAVKLVSLRSHLFTLNVSIAKHQCIIFFVDVSDSTASVLASRLLQACGICSSLRNRAKVCHHILSHVGNIGKKIGWF